MTLGVDDFAPFFRAVHGVEPFPWQRALVEYLADGDAWPDVLDIPTGCGKTAALDAAVFHLALRADAPSRSAIRIALVVDRRLVVDDAHARAERIAAALASSSDDFVQRVAKRLRALSLDGPPLVAQRLRGGAPLEALWARSPTQPTVLCSTVDQVGSRLFFRGYGVSTRMAPVHAGLLGRDTLVLLDEAHLSEPFRQTLDSVRRVGDAQTRFVLLTATPGVEAKAPFRLSREDFEDARLSLRIGAAKPARLLTASSERLVECLAEEARKSMTRLCSALAAPPAVAIVVNRVALARDVFETLRTEYDVDVTLMIGRSRDVDRDAMATVLEPFRTGADRAAARPLFVVATQCLEVGVDLDLDGLVTQAAPLDALRQRFGRLNRAGRRVPAEGAIVALADDLKAKADDPVYGDRIRVTWEALEKLANQGSIDMGVCALDKALASAGTDASKLSSPRENAPILMPAHVDLWRQTSPIPSADPEVALFLHGPSRGPAEVSVVWRRDIDEADLDATGGVDLGTLLSLVPPRAAEAIDLPLWTIRAWLADGSELGDIPDLPSAIREDQRTGRGRRVFRWAGKDSPRTGVVVGAEIRPGDLIVVPAAYGGCDAFGWAPARKAPVADVADAAGWPWRGRRWAARVTPDLFDTPEGAARLSAALAQIDSNVDNDDLRNLAAILPEGSDSGPAHSPRGAIEALADATGRIEVHFPYGDGPAGPRGAVFVAPRGLQGATTVEASPAAATEDDQTGSVAAQRTSLHDHCRDVASCAKGFVCALRLEEKLAADLVLAARLHDLGKADRRFQTALSGGDIFNTPGGPPAAKSARRLPPEAFARAGLPPGWRHEALSVRLARAHPALAEARDPQLVLWLIGTHHGLGRPFFDFSDPQAGTATESVAATSEVDDWTGAPVPGPQALDFDLDGFDWPMLFETLARRYGAWGLAHLEALLRLADHRASAEAESGP